MTFKADILLEIQNFLTFNAFFSKINYSFTKFCYFNTFDSAQGIISTSEVKGLICNKRISTKKYFVAYFHLLSNNFIY